MQKLTFMIEKFINFFPKIRLLGPQSPSPLERDLG
jgi:hypothetical protein